MSGASDELIWEKDGVDWPHRQCSRFIDAAGLRWHMQQMGSGPALLLLHGTGAATHSWRGVAPLLAQHFRVLALDLPGHGFTQALPNKRLSISGMSEAISELLVALNIAPQLVIGHSAGAAIAVRMCLDEYIAPVVLFSLNGALLPPLGLPGLIFSPAAKLFAKNPLVPRLFAWRAADPLAVQRLLRSTGSKLDPEGVSLYSRLVSNAAHVRNVLAMMANWNLRSIESEIAKLKPSLLLLVGSNDGTVPASEAQRVRRLLPSAPIITLPGLGHLAHEEQPQQVVELIMQLLQNISTPEMS